MDARQYQDQITKRTARYIDELIMVGHLPAIARNDAVIEIDRVVDTFLQSDKIKTAGEGK